jgi:hypothetical protein
MDLLLWIVVLFVGLLLIALVIGFIFLLWVFGHGRLDPQNKKPRPGAGLS